jgi:hypothetical protein
MCNIQCSGVKCDRRVVDVRLDTLPQNLPWPTIGWRLVCKECGTAGSVDIVPNWHDMTNARVPFSKRLALALRLPFLLSADGHRLLAGDLRPPGYHRR